MSREGPNLGELRPLSDLELDNLIERVQLARIFDARGWDVRLMGYAERIALLPRLLATLVVQRDTLRAMAGGASGAPPGEARPCPAGAPPFATPDARRRLHAIALEVESSAVTGEGWEQRDERGVLLALAAQWLRQIEEIDRRALQRRLAP